MSQNIPYDELVDSLAKGMEAGEVFQFAPHGASDGPQIMRSNAWRRAVRFRLELAKTQAQLVAARYAPHAISALVNLLRENKPELTIKAALAVLEEARIGDSAPAQSGSSAENHHSAPLSTDDLAALIIGLQALQTPAPKAVPSLKSEI